MSNLPVGGMSGGGRTAAPPPVAQGSEASSTPALAKLFAPAKNGSSAAATTNPFAGRGTNTALLAGGFAGKLKRKANKVREKRRELELRSKSAILAVRTAPLLCAATSVYPHTHLSLSHPRPLGLPSNRPQIAVVCAWSHELVQRLFALLSHPCRVAAHHRELDGCVDLPWCH
eukprot:788958-Prymnesium_polylepis.1